MYSLVGYMNPAPEKMEELLDVLRERNKVSNANGYPHLVAQHMFTSEPALTLVTQFKDLEALEDWTERNRKDEAFQEAGRRINAACVRPMALELLESLAQSQPSGTVNYFLSATAFAAPGKAAELRQSLEKAFPESPANGTVLRALHRRLVPEEGASYTQVFGFERLSGLETLMHNPAFGAGATALSGLLNRPIRQRLFRVRMPFGG